MPNPIKGEVLIEIGGEKFPLVFSWDAIASIEAELNESVLTAQMGTIRIDRLLLFLIAGLGDAFTEETIPKDKLPPLLKVRELIEDALNVAYYGITVPEESKAKKKTPQRKPKPPPKVPSG